jgi:hypothetical protein
MSVAEVGDSSQGHYSGCRNQSPMLREAHCEVGFLF